MQLLVNGQKFDDPAPLNKAGGEGELYALDSANLAKVYHEHLRNDERRQKLLALCDSYANHVARGGSHAIAFPEFPAYELAVSLDTLVGFSMHWFKNCPEIGELGFDLARGQFNEAGGYRFDDAGAVAFLYDLFAAVEQLHQARVVLGDVNSGNILCDPATRKPVIIDVDAAQMGGFACRTTHPNYNDPQLESRGKGLGGNFTFDFGTDIFALAVVCFEFLVGARPHQLFVTPPKRDTENKALGISSIRCFTMGRAYLSQLGVSYFECKENELIERRLHQIKALDRRLFDFFAGVFVRDERDNVLFSLPLTDPKHPGHQFFVASGFKRVVDEEVKKRQQRATVQARQGLGQRASTVPDSGFRQVIAALSPAGLPAAQAAPKVKKPPPVRPDPEAFDVFLRHFDLRLTT